MNRNNSRQLIVLWKNYPQPDGSIIFQYIEIIIFIIVMTTAFLTGVYTFDIVQRKIKSISAFEYLPQLRMQVMMHYDIYGEWPDDLEVLEPLKIEISSVALPSGYRPQSFSNLLDNYQARGAFIKEEINFAQNQIAVGKTKKPAKFVPDFDVDYMVVDGSITFNLKGGVVRKQPISLLSFRPTSSRTPYAPSYYWSCGREMITAQRIAQGPNHTTLERDDLLSICR